MPSQPNFGLLGPYQSVTESVQSAILGQQNIDQNQNILDQQRRADAANKAMAQIATQPDLAGIDDNTFRQLLGPIAAHDAKAAASLIYERRQKQDLGALLQNPNPQSVAAFGMKYPDAYESIKKPFDALDARAKDEYRKTSASVYSLLANGENQRAIDLLQSHMDSAQQSGEDVSSYPQLIDYIRNNPQGALALSAINASVALGADNFEKAYGLLDPASARKREAEAVTAETEAAYAPDKAESDLATAEAGRQKTAADIQNIIESRQIDWARLGLDKDRLETETSLKLEELHQSATALSAGSEKLMNEAGANAVQFNAGADKLDNLARRIDATDMTRYGGYIEKVKAMWGSQDDYTQLRAEFQQLINSEAMKARINMPGAMSDGDRKFLLQGFPPANANPEYVSGFLKAMANAQRGIGGLEDRKAMWIGSNGNYGPARQPFVINGYRIPKGMTPAQMESAMGKINAPALTPEQQGVINRAGGQ